MKPFLLVREEDETGISGTGVVAEGVQFLDGKVALRWQTRNAHHSTVIWDDIESVVAIHGHNGKTHIFWYDPSGKHLVFPTDVVQ